ncbi:MAG: hypothetical protein Q8K60_04155, partial [Parachlamydiaceae bacterium]|nr:hypothetical protein [Parachlamydiaceae bacterium]
GLKFADALFILHVGAESLPQAYTLTSFGMLGVACFLLYGFHRLSSYHIYLTILIIGVFFYLFVLSCRFLEIGIDSQWFWYSLKLVGFFLFAVLMTCYWTFIDQYHHMQDAKRLYSLFSSTIFLGATSTGIVMYLGFLDLNHLIILILFLFTCTFFWVRKIAKELPLIAHEETEQGQPVYEEGNSFKFLIRSILSSPFTMLLMSFNLLIYLLLVITEYNYLFTFQNYFVSQHDQNLGGGTEAQLTLFLGQWLASVSASNLIFGLFVYSRLVRRWGISFLPMITPVLLIIAFTGWTLSPSLIFPLIGFFVVEGTSYVIDDSNFNLLLNAVPSKFKYKIRVMIESFFEPIGMLLSAILLSFFQQESKLLGLILAVCLLIVAAILRSNYLKAVFFNLSDNAIHFHRSIKDWFGKMSIKQKKSAESRLLAILKLNNEGQIFACEGLLAFDDPTILKQLLRITSTMDSSIKIKLLDLFEKSIFSVNPLVLDAIHEWANQSDDSLLKSAIRFYLAKQSLLDPEAMINDLNSTNIQLKGAAIISLKKAFVHLPSVTISKYQSLSKHFLNLLLESSNEDELAMGLQILGIDGGHQEVDLLISFINHPSLTIARAASQSLAKIGLQDPVQQASQVISLLTQISDNDVRLSCIKSLETLNDDGLVKELILSSLHFRPNERRLIENVVTKIGSKTVPVLLSILQDTIIHDRCRLLAGRILGNLALPELRSTLSGIIRKEIERAYFYFYHYHTIQELHPDLDLHILKDMLITDYHSVLDFIIQLLGVAGEVEDEELLSRSLRSPNPKVRSQVVETLEKTCEKSIFRLLQPLVEDIPHQEKIRGYIKSGQKPMNLKSLLDKISRSASQIDQIIAAAMKYHLNFPDWQEAILQQKSSQDEIFHHFADELLET